MNIFHNINQKKWLFKNNGIYLKKKWKCLIIKTDKL